MNRGADLVSGTMPQIENQITSLGGAANSSLICMNYFHYIAVQLT